MFKPHVYGLWFKIRNNFTQFYLFSTGPQISKFKIFLGIIPLVEDQDCG
jgi:hypothetical protein